MVRPLEEPCPVSNDDGMARLVSVNEGGAGSWSQSYGYDRFGNRWVAGSSGLPVDPRTPDSSAKINAANNRLTGANYGYDAAGNQTIYGGWTLGYDAENRLVSSQPSGGSVTMYAYDGEGRRVKKTTNGVSTVYVYAADGELAAEYGGTAQTAGTRYLTADHLGSVRLVTDASGNVLSRHDYLPFGEEIPAGVGGRTTGMGYVANPAVTQKFTGKERDGETGLDFFESRYFSAAQGRFTSSDVMIGKPEWLVDPQRWNRYAYVRNNPPKYVDPDGEDLVVYYSLGSDVSDADREWFNWNKASILAGIQAKFEKAGVKNVSFRDQSTLSKEQLSALDRGSPFGVSRLTFVGKDYPGLGQVPQMGVLGYAHPDGKRVAAVFLDTFPKAPPAGCDQVCIAVNVAAHELGHTLDIPHLSFMGEMADRWRQRPAMLGGTETRPDLMTGSMGTPTQPLYFKPGSNERVQRAIEQLNRIGDMTPNK
ncbi:MAG: hypothetical protein LC114_11230 [Bryobacterales bacterium]|nr:hypothetical protein [Bryobacterales bacterium]